MSPSAESVEHTRRQLRPIRTELEVVADTLVRLFDVGVLPATPSTIARVADVVGIPRAELTAARRRYDQRGYLTPAVDEPAIGRVPDTADNPATAAAKFHSDDTARAYAAGSARGRRHGADVRSRQPAAGADQMTCTKCGRCKHVEHFNRRADRPQTRWTVCNECRSAAQRARYLSAAKLQAMNAARVTFVVDEFDDVLTVTCMDCNRPFVAGDVVYGDASLHHLVCSHPQTGVS